MDQQKIGEKIKELRKQNNLTQAEFAEQFSVTYQAVSKWENGKNIPDIDILKQICEKYQLNLNDFLMGKTPEKKKKKINLYLLIIIILIILLIVFLFFQNNKKKDFEFKTLSSSCNNFNISGSIAYNKKKSSIYISHITYCGGADNLSYQHMKCTLYESNGDIEKKLSDYEYQGKEEITLEDFLKKVQFHIDNYESNCPIYGENSLFLEIDATESDGETISYKIPLSLKDNCSNN